MFRPCGGILPYTDLVLTLRLSHVPAPVLRLQLQFAQAPKVLLESVADQRRPIHLLPLRSKIRGLAEPGIEHHLYGFHLWTSFHSILANAAEMLRNV